jgi:hypothetical protein
MTVPASHASLIPNKLYAREIAPPEYASPQNTASARGRHAPELKAEKSWCPRAWR